MKLNKNMFIAFIVVIVVAVSAFVLFQYVYTKYYTDGTCGGVAGRICSEGYSCKGAMQQNEGLGICTKDSGSTDTEKCALEGDSIGGSRVGAPTKCCDGLKAVPDWDTSKLQPPGVGSTCRPN